MAAVAVTIFVPAAEAAHWRHAPPVPQLTKGMRAALDKRVRPHRADVLSRVGDSITCSQFFLQGLACGEQDLADYAYLAPAIRCFHRTRFPQDLTEVECGVSDSFSRKSAAASGGKDSAWLLTPGAADTVEYCRADESPLECEYRRVRPGWAIILVGTNDPRFEVPPAEYRANLRRIVAISLDRGVVPILSTLPPMTRWPTLDLYGEAYSAIVYRLARDRKLPVINLWRALSPSGRMYIDGLHPSVYVSYSCAPFCRPLDFSREGLEYGHNMRNLITLHTLHHLLAVVR